MTEWPHIDDGRVKTVLENMWYLLVGSLGALVEP
jgi:hypothetical protein